MNWFERYGVVGSYFLIMVSLWIFGFSIEPQFATEHIAEVTTPLKNLGAIFALLVLPSGYLISVFSQLLYYLEDRLFDSKDQMHKSVASEIPALEGLREKTEAEIEAIMTIWVRYFNRANSEKIEYTSSFSTRRFAVIAINKSLALASTISPIFGAIPVFYCKRFVAWESAWVYLTVLWLFSIGTIIFLQKSERILREQAKIILKMILVGR